MNQVVCVTGGGGFLGRHLVEHLAADGFTVRVLDRSPEPAWAAPMGVEYRQGEVADDVAVLAAVAGSWAVIHAAFCPPDRPTADLWATNVEGTRVVVDAALASGRPRLVVVSSTIVDRRLRRHPFLGEAPLSRLAAYRTSRIVAEHEATRATEAGLSVAVARPKTFLGPGGAGAFALVFDLVRRGRAVPVMGSGDNSYQLCDVRDLAAGLVLLAASDAQGCFGFGATHYGTVNDDLASLLVHAGTGARLRHAPGWLARPGLRAVELAGLAPLSEWHNYAARRVDSVIDVSRSTGELGWVPVRSNADTLADAYDWYERQQGAPTTRPVPRAHRLLARAAGGRARHVRSG